MLSQPNSKVNIDSRSILDETTTHCSTKRSGQSLMSQAYSQYRQRIPKLANQSRRPGEIGSLVRRAWSGSENDTVDMRQDLEGKLIPAAQIVSELSEGGIRSEVPNQVKESTFTTTTRRDQLSTSQIVCSSAPGRESVQSREKSERRFRV